MREKKRLFTPGPTEVPPRVLRALSQPLLHHRTPCFQEMLTEATEGLRYVYRTENPVLILACSGTGAMEAAVANLTAQGEKVIVTVSGKFGQRWFEIASAYGLEVVKVEAEWGRVVPAGAVADAFAANEDASVLFTTHCETSTGVLQDVKNFASLARERGALVVVDAITSLCANEVDTDGWGLDVVVGGAQKGFMIPPGLSFLSLSARARERMEKSDHPRYYLDLSRALQAAEQNGTPFTPAISLVVALNEALAMIKEEGREEVLGRHARNAAAVRAAVRALGLELLAEIPANAVTAVKAPAGRAAEIIGAMEERYGVKVAGGQGKLKGRIFRLGHLGFYDRADVCTLVSALEAALSDLALIDRPGRGVEAALAVLTGGGED